MWWSLHTVGVFFFTFLLFLLLIRLLTLSMMLESKSEKPTVAVIGAGFVWPRVVSKSQLMWFLCSASGICTYIELEKKLGIQASLFEMEDDLGGTWRQNTYPFASCDIPSHVYSLRSDLNPSKSCWPIPKLSITDMSSHRLVSNL